MRRHYSNLSHGNISTRDFCKATNSPQTQLADRSVAYFREDSPSTASTSRSSTWDTSRSIPESLGASFIDINENYQPSRQIKASRDSHSSTGSVSDYNRTDGYVLTELTILQPTHAAS